MSSQWLCVAPANGMGSTSAISDSKHAITNMRDQLNDETSHTYHYYDTDDPLSPHGSEYSDDAEGEKQYIRDCLQELYERGTAMVGDSWLIPDGWEVYGYGRGHVSWSPPDADGQIMGARVIHTPSQWFVTDPKETYYNLAIHEMGHNLSAWHHMGDYDTYYDGDYRIRDVTPMGTVYVYTDDGHNDTCWENSNNRSGAPDDFCGRTVQDYLGKFCDHNTCEATCRHDMTMSSCTVSAIEDNTPI